MPTHKKVSLREQKRRQKQREASWEKRNAVFAAKMAALCDSMDRRLEIRTDAFITGNHNEFRTDDIGPRGLSYCQY